MTRGREGKEKASESSQTHINKGFELMLRTFSTPLNANKDSWFQIKFDRTFSWFKNRKINLFFEFAIKFLSK